MTLHSTALLACIKAGWNARQMAADTPEEQALLRQSMAAHVHVCKRTLQHIVSIWRTAKRIYELDAEAYFRMDARARRRVVRGSHSVSEELYRDIARICKFASLRDPAHPRKQSHPNRHVYVNRKEV